ncbi:hypothetical protein Agub_g9351 [Astrephomene gubernaculifera]|uniref:FHA domain-containing protein n=1 Tax=Astrephomene gubernaculifera TaxID=47775 RepID=A0AAD3HP91_9CHLO|nr:hypothetical protein Agub_g9351 [Astrephomene gubernaculifera]
MLTSTFDTVELETLRGLPCVKPHDHSPTPPHLAPPYLLTLSYLTPLSMPIMLPIPNALRPPRPFPFPAATLPPQMRAEKRRRSPSRSPPPREGGRGERGYEEDPGGGRGGGGRYDRDREYGSRNETHRDTRERERERGRDRERDREYGRDAGGSRSGAVKKEVEEGEGPQFRRGDEDRGRSGREAQRDRERDRDRDEWGSAGAGGGGGSGRDRPPLCDRPGGAVKRERGGGEERDEPTGGRGGGGGGGGSGRDGKRERGNGDWGSGGGGGRGGGGGGGGGRGGRDAESSRYMSREEREEKEREAEEAARPKAPKEQPNIGLSGKLAADANKVGPAGAELKHVPPPEGRKPDKRWRLYVFKNDTLQDEPFHIHRMDHYLFGRDVSVADIITAHPSCSKQHAVLQFRLTHKEDELGLSSAAIRPYLLDLGSVNGTFLNGERLEALRYYELLEKDVVRFGLSSREYVLLHDKSGDD